jgi:hypothetical protein
MKRTGLWVLALVASVAMFDADTASADGLPRIRLYLPEEVDGDPEEPQGTFSGPADSIFPDQTLSAQASSRVSLSEPGRCVAPFAQRWHAAILRFLDLARRAHWIPGR